MSALRGDFMEEVPGVESLPMNPPVVVGEADYDGVDLLPLHPGAQFLDGQHPAFHPPTSGSIRLRERSVGIGKAR
jgi:hypothetical protein